MQLGPSRPENLHRLHRLHRGRISGPLDRPLESRFYFFCFCFVFTACKWLLSSPPPPPPLPPPPPCAPPSPIVGPPLWLALQGVLLLRLPRPLSPSLFFFVQLSRNEDQAWATRLFHKVLLCQRAHQLGCLKFYHRHGRRISAAPQKPTQPGPAPVEPEVTRR